MHRLSDKVCDTQGAALRRCCLQWGMAAKGAAWRDDPPGGARGITMEHALDLPLQAEQAEDAVGLIFVQTSGCLAPGERALWDRLPKR